MTLFEIGFIPFTIWDVIDIALVMVIYYQLLRIVKGTRAYTMLLGLAFLLLFSLLVQVLNLSVLSLLFDHIATIWVIALVIIFQPELRRLLIQLGQSRIFRTIFNISESSMVDEIVAAAADLSRRQYGGLFVLAREIGLQMVVETGVELQAKVTSPLLVSIFFPRTPLHDGAAIIHHGQIVAAKCTLPISANPEYEATLGTRHRAGLGVTEDSDAVVVIVSEETGGISIASEGQLLPMENETELRHTLNRMLGLTAEATPASPDSSTSDAKPTADQPPAAS